MSQVTRFAALLCLLITCAASAAEAQVSAAVQVPLETNTGWGPIKAPAGYKTLRVQGISPANAFVLARLFADFAAHPSMFPRVVDGVDILACEGSSLKARYRTVFDPKPGGKTMVESLTTVRASVVQDRIEFIWSSDKVESSYVNAAWGRALFVTRRTANGSSETLIDYVSAVRPKNSAKGVLVESQKSVLANDARYVIDRLMAAARPHTATDVNVAANAPMFACSAK
ncbi:MAG TPA: hypothetical protein VGD27_19930 [Longimicrobiales bacterium]